MTPVSLTQERVGFRLDNGTGQQNLRNVLTKGGDGLKEASIHSVTKSEYRASITVSTLSPFIVANNMFSRVAHVAKGGLCFTLERFEPLLLLSSITMICLVLFAVALIILLTSVSSKFASRLLPPRFTIWGILLRQRTPKIWYAILSHK